MKKAIQFAKSIIALSIFVLLQSFPANAQNTDADKTLSPYFFVKSENAKTDQLPLKSTQASVNIAGVIADVTVTQQYENTGSTALEAIYVFPTSTRAAVYALEMKIGDRTIQAKIEEREKARKDYEKAKSSGKRATLLEQERPNVFQMNVANIMPGDKIEVILHYTEVLIPEEGTYQFVYPTVVGPRYSNQPATAILAKNKPTGGTPYLKEGEPAPYSFDIEVNLSVGMTLQFVTCPTHKVKVKHESLGLANVQLEPAEKSGGNRDFILKYGLSGGQIESGLLLYEHEDEHFFLAMMQPPKRVLADQIPPREYVFIVDVSGSMRGFPLDISKKLLRDLITGLKPSDKFNVLLFAGTSGWLAEESLFANTENLNKAVNLIDNQRGGGGTELLPALKKAMFLPRCEENLSRSIVIVTDGYVTVEKEAFDLISNNLNQANVFSFGIGSGVNRYIIEGLAHVGGGEPMVITNPDEAHNSAEQFRKYINSPVLTQVEAAFEGIEIYDVEPRSLPDVLAERPVILFGKYKGSPKGTIKIKGFTNEGVYEKSFNVGVYKPSKRNQALRSLWARERIKMLDDYKHVRGSGDHKKEITDLGLKYSLMTAFTSFIAIDQEKVTYENGKSEVVKQALPLPQGVTNAAVGFDMGIQGVVRRSSKPKKAEIDFTVKNVIGVNSSLPENFEKALYNKVKALSLSGSKFSTLQVEIQVNNQGKVISVKIDGKGLTEAFKTQLESKILQWQFSDLLIKDSLQLRFELSATS